MSAAERFVTLATWLFLIGCVAGWFAFVAAPELRRHRGFRSLPYHVPADGRRGQ